MAPKKNFLFYSIIILNLVVIIFTIKFEKNFNHNSYNSKGEESFSGNPYLILRVAPWAKFKDIENRYTRLKDRAEAQNTIYSKRFKLYTYAYEKIKSEYEKNNYKDKSFFGVLKTAFRNILIYELIMLGMLLLSWFVYKFNKFAAWLVMTFVTIDNLIPHWFNTMFTQYIVSFVIGTIIYFREYLYPFICGSKNNNENNNTNNSNTGNARKRKRFEKIE